MGNLLSIKPNRKHSILEYRIKEKDSSQDMSRSAVFEREVRAAQGVENWEEISRTLSDLKVEEKATTLKSFQANYDDVTAKILDKVKADICSQLPIKRLQTQYMVQLLQKNYLEKLIEEKLKMKEDKLIYERDVDLPEMSKIFIEMMLKDKECSELKEIRKILVDWRNK